MCDDVVFLFLIVVAMGMFLRYSTKSFCSYELILYCPLFENLKNALLNAPITFGFGATNQSKKTGSDQRLNYQLQILFYCIYEVHAV